MTNSQISLKKSTILIALIGAIIVTAGVSYIASYFITTTFFIEEKEKKPLINIITPENKTYTGPMSGYYPGTFGFENDPVGSPPSGWGYGIGVGISEQVIEDFGNHKHVVEIYDDTSSDTARIINSFSNIYSGVIEFWLCTNDSYKDTYIRLRGSTILEIAVVIRIFSNNFQCYDQSSWVDVLPVINNSWYHFRFEFNCFTDIYDCWINDILEADDFGFHDSNVDYVTTFQFYITTPANHTKVYIDAVGYSWDPNYNIGDNYNEGLLLSFTPVNFNWMGYSLNSQNIISIMGNTTIPMSISGLHTIQVFGYDSSGTLYESKVRYFTTT